VAEGAIGVTVAGTVAVVFAIGVAGVAMMIAGVPLTAAVGVARP
jgi:hypothetical protein